MPVPVFNRLGFHGAYLDALSAAPFCYGFHRHAHPVGVNEQLVGIKPDDRLHPFECD